MTTHYNDFIITVSLMIIKWEVTNRFKGLDLIDKVPEEHGRRFMILYKRQ